MSSIRQNLATVIAKNLHSKPHSAKEIAAYLLETNQVSQLESLIRDVMAKNETEGIIEAEIYSAHPLSDDAMESAKNIIKSVKPNAKKVSVVNIIDVSQIGGLKISLAHEQIDMTTRTKLDTFKRLTAEGVN